MWYALLWRVLSWFTWTHIQWLMVQALGPKGIEMALDRMISNILHDEKFANKSFSKITAQDLREHCDTSGVWKGKS